MDPSEPAKLRPGRGLLYPPAFQPNHNLPTQLSSFVGRELELRELCQLLPATRLLTLVGPGGIGKTRLAQQLAGSVVRKYRDGVWLIELAALSESALVVDAIADALRVVREPATLVIESLIEALRGQQLLLVIDNCEHLILACAEVVHRLLLECPGLSVLATSREPLRFAGESVWRVPGLATLYGASDQATSVKQDNDAVRLFTERARAANSGFRITERNAPAVSALCQALEGMPLAIELAATRMNVLSAEQLVARLSDQIGLLTGGSRAGPTRQETMGATLEWSYRLLSAAEQRLFKHLAVFVGGWTLEGAQSVYGQDADARTEVVGLLGKLIDKSLVLSRPDAHGEPRFFFLEPIRQYARMKLAEDGALSHVQDMHAAFYMSLAEGELTTLVRADPRLAKVRFDSENDNLRAVLHRLIERNNTEGAWRLGEQLCSFWYLHLHFEDARVWVRRLVELEGGNIPTRIALLQVVGLLAWASGDLGLLQVTAEKSLTLARESHPDGIADSLYLVGLAGLARGEYAMARAVHEEGLELSRGSGRTHLALIHTVHLVAIARDLGDYGLANTLGSEALALATEHGYPRIVASLQVHLGFTSYYAEDHIVARSTIDQALRTLSDLGPSIEAGSAQLCFGLIAMDNGDPQSGRSALTEALAAALGGQIATGIIGHYDLLLRSLAGFAQLASNCDQPGRALRLGAAVGSRRTRVGLSPVDPQALILESHLSRARETLGERAATSAERAGRAMTLQQLIDEAMGVEVTKSASTPGGSVAPEPSLTRREVEVARLIARGLSNRQIARELVIAEYTAERHVHHILTKLGLTSRTQIAAWVFQHLSAVERPRSLEVLSGSQERH